MKKPTHAARVVIVTCSGTPPSEELARKLKRVYPPNSLEFLTFEDAPRSVPQLNEEDRLLLCEDAGRPMLARLLELLRLGRFAVPALVVLSGGGAEVLKRLSAELGLPCVAAECSATELARAFRHAYEPGEASSGLREGLDETIKASPAPFVLANPLFKTVDANAEFAELLKASRAQLLGRPITEFAGAESATRFTRIPLPVQDEDFLAELTDAQGGKKQVVVRRRPCFAGSLLVGCVYVFSETAEFKVLLRDLKEDSERIVAAKKDLESALDAISNPIVIVDTESKVRRANRAFAQRLGRPFGGIIGKPCQSLLGCVKGEPFPLARGDASQGPVSAPHVAIKGLKGVFQVDSFPRHEPDGRPRGWVHLMREVWGDAARPLGEARAKSIATESFHQLTNCLTSIVGLAQLAEADEETPKQVREDLRKIVEQAKRIAEIAPELRDGADVSRAP